MQIQVSYRNIFVLYKIFAFDTKTNIFQIKNRFSSRKVHLSFENQTTKRVQPSQRGKPLQRTSAKVQPSQRVQILFNVPNMQIYLNCKIIYKHDLSIQNQWS